MQFFILQSKRARSAGPGAVACLTLLLIFARIAVTVAGDTGDVARLSAHQVNSVLGRPDTIIIDVRKYRNWWRSSKKIPGAKREEPVKVDKWYRKYDRDQTLIFYCS